MLDLGRKLVPTLLLLPLLLSANCSSKINSTMDNWMGRHYSQLLDTWGPPDEVFDDGANRILLYITGKTVKSGDVPDSTETPIGRSDRDLIWNSNSEQPRTFDESKFKLKSYRAFWITPKGMIYRYKWRGI